MKKYVTDSNGEFYFDRSKVNLYHKILLYTFYISLALIPISLIENIWFDVLPTTKIFGTALLNTIVFGLWIRIELYEIGNEDDFNYRNLVLREEFRLEENKEDDNASTN